MVAYQEKQLIDGPALFARIMWFWLLMVLWECGCQRQRAIVTHVTCHTPRNVAFMLAPLHGTYMHTQ